MAITKGATINRAALLDRVEQSNGSGRRQPKPKVQIHRSTGDSRGGRRLSADGDKHTVDQVMHFEIYTPEFAKHQRFVEKNSGHHSHH